MFILFVIISLVYFQVGSIVCFKASNVQPSGTSSNTAASFYPTINTKHETIPSNSNVVTNRPRLDVHTHSGNNVNSRVNLQTSYEPSIIMAAYSTATDSLTITSLTSEIQTRLLSSEQKLNSTSSTNVTVTPTLATVSSHTVTKLPSHGSTTRVSNLTRVSISSALSSIALSSAVFSRSSVYGVSSSTLMLPFTSSTAIIDQNATSVLKKSTKTTFQNTTIAPSKVLPLISPPPLLQNYSIGLQSPPCMISGSCCRHGFQQLPSQVHFKESTRPGFVLAEMRDVGNVTISITHVYPQQLVPFLNGYFGVTHEHSFYKVVLNQEIDLEDLYLKLNKTLDVRQFKIQLGCLENGNPLVSTTINVTVEDVDDAMPVFDHAGSQQTCVVPVYKAGTSEDYTGHLEISPGRIRAVDGDISKHHRILYTVMHAEPDNYQEYFYLDQVEGTVNKTRTMNASDPRKYVIFVQAVEDSVNQNARVAILSIEVYAPLQPGEKPITVDPTVKYALQIISALVLVGFAAGILVIIHHRYRRRLRVKVSCEEPPQSDMHKTPIVSNDGTPDIPVITSPSHITVQPKNKPFLKKKILIVKKPLDTGTRPGWNAPVNKVKKTKYNPYFAVQRVKKN